MRSDGDENPKNRELVEDYDVAYWEEERLFPIENGGAMIARILELYLHLPTRFLFRIDTDTAVYRRFRFLPEQNGIFGSLQKNREACVSIQGGCTGFSEDAARSIVDSGILQDPRLKDPLSYRQESLYFSPMARRAKRCGLSSVDWILGWVASELKIPMFSFSEVHCRWHPGGNCKNEALEFAVTHPVYF